jgi:plasmid stabilization system protein ParE
VTVVWTRTAQRDLLNAHDHVAPHSPHYARRLVDRITRKTEQLERHPLLGAEVLEYADATVRELFEHPYRIIDRVRDDRVEVVAVVHGARQLPPASPGGP